MYWTGVQRSFVRLCGWKAARLAGKTSGLSPLNIGFYARTEVAVIVIRQYLYVISLASFHVPYFCDIMSLKSHISVTSWRRKGFCHASGKYSENDRPCLYSEGLHSSRQPSVVKRHNYGPRGKQAITGS